STSPWRLTILWHGHGTRNLQKGRRKSRRLHYGREHTRDRLGFHMLPLHNGLKRDFGSSFLSRMSDSRFLSLKLLVVRRLLPPSHQPSRCSCQPADHTADEKRCHNQNPRLLYGKNSRYLT